MRVTSETAKALALDLDSFNTLLGPLRNATNRAEGQSNLKETDHKGKAVQGGRDAVMLRLLVCFCVCACVCVCVFVCSGTYLHAYIHASYMHTFTQLWIICICICVCVRVCVMCVSV